MGNSDAFGRDVVRAAATGILFGAVLGVAFLVFAGGLAHAVIGGLIGGLLVGITSFRLARATRTQAVLAREALGFDLTPGVRRDALRGRPAADPVERQRQLAVVHYVLGRIRPAASRNVVFFLAFAGLQVAQAVATSGWFWLGAALFLLLALITPWEVARLRRRQMLLASTP